MFKWFWTIFSLGAPDRNDQGSIPGNAWIFQVLFQLLGLSILYWKIIFTFIKSLHSTKQYISLQTWVY